MTAYQVWRLASTGKARQGRLNRLDCIVTGRADPNSAICKAPAATPAAFPWPPVRFAGMVATTGAWRRHRCGSPARPLPGKAVSHWPDLARQKSVHAFPSRPWPWGGLGAEKPTTSRRWRVSRADRSLAYSDKTLAPSNKTNANSLPRFTLGGEGNGNGPIASY
jgi:hypothetical protein